MSEIPKTPFNKPNFNIEEQITLLQSRGLIVEDISKAKEQLKHINYYRLRSYWLVFEEDRERHIFKNHTNFNTVIDLYNFDSDLRLLFSEAIEKIEISVRASFIQEFAATYRPCSYVNKEIYRSEYHFDIHKSKIIESINANKNSSIFIKHFQEKYIDEYPPIWAVTEIMSFGLIAKLYKNLKELSLKSEISYRYDLNHRIFSSFIEHLSYIRNLCAHHSRLWNRICVKSIIIPNGNNYLSSHLNQDKKIYNSIIILLYFIEKITNNHIWKDKLYNLLISNEQFLSYMGFPENWKEQDT